MLETIQRVLKTLLKTLLTKDLLNNFLIIDWSKNIFNTAPETS